MKTKNNFYQIDLFRYVSIDDEETRERFLLVRDLVWFAYVAIIILMIKQDISMNIMEPGTYRLFDIVFHIMTCLVISFSNTTFVGTLVREIFMIVQNIRSLFVLKGTSSVITIADTEKRKYNKRVHNIVGKVYLLMIPLLTFLFIIILINCNSNSYLIGIFSYFWSYFMVYCSNYRAIVKIVNNLFGA